jgi:hypothetical protein
MAFMRMFFQNNNKILSISWEFLHFGDNLKSYRVMSDSWEFSFRVIQLWRPQFRGSEILWHLQTSEIFFWCDKERRRVKKSQYLMDVIYERPLCEILLQNYFPLLSEHSESCLLHFFVFVLSIDVYIILLIRSLYKITTSNIVLEDGNIYISSSSKNKHSISLHITVGKKYRTKWILLW